MTPTSTDPRIADLSQDGAKDCADCRARFRPQYLGDDLCAPCHNWGF